MKPILYFFGSFSGQLKSYPFDHSKEIFTSAIKHSKNSSQIILIRKGNLLYYCYLYRVNSQQLFGICLCLDCIYADIHRMFQIFDAIYAHLIHEGKIVGIDSKGNIKFLIKDYFEEDVEIQEVYHRILRELDLNKKNSVILPPIDLSVSIDSLLELSIENDSQERIIEASKHYSNLYIVRLEAEIERVTGFSNVVKGLCKEKDALQLKIKKDQDEIAKLKRQKKQTTIVLILLCIIIIGGLIVYNYATDKEQTIRLQSNKIEGLTNRINQLTTDSSRLEENLLSVKTSLASTQIELKQKNSELDEKVSMIESLQENVNKLETKLSNVETKLEDTKGRLELYRQNITNTPLIIEEISVANTYYDGAFETNYGGYLKSSASRYIAPRISYYGLISGSKTIYIKLFYPNGELVTLMDNKSPKGYTNSYSRNISKGENTMVLNGIGGDKKGHWPAGKYKYEFYCDGKLIGIHEFTIH